MYMTGDLFGLYQHLENQKNIDLGKAISEESSRDGNIETITSEEANKGQALLESILSKVGATIVSSVTPTMAYGEAAIPKYSTGIPPDDFLLKLMNQSVEETLKGTKVTYVNDDNYQKEVFGSDKPVMVLFYNNLSKGSQGLTALTTVLE